MQWRHCLLSLVLVAVLASACKRNGPTGPTPDDEASYSAIGASDGIGFGGSVPCVPFDPDCPSGTGYVYLLKRRLQSDGLTVTLSNRSVPGAVLSPAIQTLSREIGRDVLTNLLDQAAPFIANDSTHVTIFTGGNDANVIAQNVRAGRGGADIRAFIDQHVNQWGADLLELIHRVRTRAGSPRIVAYNLPNLGAAPYVASLSTLERSLLQRIAVSLSDRVNALAAQNVIVVDLMCEPRLYDVARFSSDGFHPSDSGYALMAELGYPGLRNGTARAPSTTCPQRTLLPAF
jgi:lysophospholipase L1-like esterase